MANKKLKVKLLRNNSELPTSHNGNYYDCFVSKATVIRGDEVTEHSVGIVRYRPGDTVILHLGFSAEVGKGYVGLILPRSSTFKKYGLILTNSMGVVDDTYCGDEDEWKAMMWATRGGAFMIGDNALVQITLQKALPLDIEKVETLGNPNRGGYGTTGN